ncbi:MAG TPA: phosphotransferase [Pseudonocardia sp.]|nr:phosphotransferase [Pseudonocardia sp.]
MITTEARDERDRVAHRAVAAAATVAAEHGLPVHEPLVLHDLFSVRVHLRPAPVVARIPTWVARLRSDTGGLSRELDVARYLVHAGVPVVPPSPELPAGPHHRDGFTISYWTYCPADHDRPAPTADDCAAMLPDLHATLREYPGPLPSLAPLLDLPGWLAQLEAADHPVASADRTRLQRAVERLHPILQPDAADRPLHGDVHPGNLLATRNGLLWNDFEEVCRGPLEWDLATMGDEQAVRDLPHDPARLAHCGRARSTQIALLLLLLRPVFADEPGWDGGIRWALDTLGS